MIGNDVKKQIRDYLRHLRYNIIIESFLQADVRSRELGVLLSEISKLSGKAEYHENKSGSHAVRRPSFVIRRVDSEVSVGFAGLPLDHEFDTLVLALLQVGGHPPRLTEHEIEQIKSISEDCHFESYFSPACHNCPEVVQSLNMMSIINPKITHTAIDGSLFSCEVGERDIRSVPQIFLNKEFFLSGRCNVTDILRKLGKTADICGLAAKNPVTGVTGRFDVLVIGGGPAGVSAAIYTARKGLRTGLVAENFGGNVQEIALIENLISVPEIIGGTLVRNMAQHLRRYEVEFMHGVQVERMFAPTEVGGWFDIRLDRGDPLKARTVIAATGAGWRRLSVEGEETYYCRGVSCCSHSDGLAYRDKDIAVIGGGNNGVSTAINMAGIAAHVTLLQNRPALVADSILQEKLKSLLNVRVLLNAETIEIRGDGRQVTGLRWKNREDGHTNSLMVDGIFVQIGFKPNVGWLENQVALSPYGEIVTDLRGRTSLPGFFAAGDVTTLPDKQIIIAMGTGARAALSAFDYILHLPV